jgi:hypothetical protein
MTGEDAIEVASWHIQSDTHGIEAHEIEGVLGEALRGRAEIRQASPEHVKKPRKGTAAPARCGCYTSVTTRC